MLEVRGLEYGVGSVAILRSVNVSFRKGKVTGIIGPNGCGKSTLLGHLSRTLTKKGTVFLEGKDILTFTGREYARKVAMLSQQRESMTNDLRAREVVLMGRYPYKEPFSDYTTKDREVAQWVMDMTRVTSLANKKMRELSGGEKQRVYIAKALTQEPEILLLDEPTNHLDIQFKISLMKELRHFEGTVIVVLHDLNLAARYCDDVVLMKEGSIVSVGRQEDIMAPEKLISLFHVPFHRITYDDTDYLLY